MNHYGEASLLRKRLRATGSQRSYGPEATQAAFLLGGIGTGNVSVGARGELRDWEIFNRSAKGQRMPYGFFSIAVKQGDKVDTRVLESRLATTLSLRATASTRAQPRGSPDSPIARCGASTPSAGSTSGMRNCPSRSPSRHTHRFIPHEPDDSGLPAAVLTYTVKNIGTTPIEVNDSR